VLDNTLFMQGLVKPWVQTMTGTGIDPERTPHDVSSSGILNLIGCEPDGRIHIPSVDIRVSPREQFSNGQGG
jgi:hypothetical protein